MLLLVWKNILISLSGNEIYSIQNIYLKVELDRVFVTNKIIYFIFIKTSI